MDDAEARELAEFYPEGRYLYYEGDLGDGLQRLLKSLRRDGIEASVSFHCPPHLLGKYYAGDEFPVGT